MSGPEGSEGGDGAEKGEGSEQDLERFRQEIQEDYGPEGVDEKSEDIPKEGVGEDQGTAEAGAKDDQGEEAAGAKAEAAAKGGDTGEQISDDDLEKFRQQVVEQYGQEGLGEDTPEGQLYNLAQEEREQAEAPGDSGVKEDVQDKPGGPVGETIERQQNLSESSTTTPAAVENYSWNDNQVAMTEQLRQVGDDGNDALGPAMETSDLHGLQVVSEERQEEARAFEVVDYGKGAVARFPKTDLEEKGAELERGENSVVGLRVKDIRTEEVETVFARYNAQDRRAEAYVDDIGGGKGSRYELLEAWRVDEERLVSEFERGRCEHLENVRLERVDEKMFLNVDDRRVELSDHRISTGGAHALLRGKLDGDDRCMIEFDGRRASVKFGRDYPVEGMWMEGDVLAVRYAQSRDISHEHRMYLEHLESPGKPSLGQFDRPEMLEHVKIFDHPERVEGVYQFVLDKEARDEIAKLLEDADNLGDHQYGMMKAEISERVVPNMLELVGWERIKRHPFNESVKEGASANDVDWLMRTPDGKLRLVEIKWQENKDNAMHKGESQVARSFDRGRLYEGSKVEGAYIAIVDWKVDDEPTKVYIKRVRPEDGIVQ